MSLKLSGNAIKLFSTNPSSHNWDGQVQATQFFVLRIDSSSPPSIPSATQSLLIYKTLSDFYHSFYPSAGPTTLLRFVLTGVNGLVSHDAYLTTGLVYPFILKWDGVAGVQKIIAAGIPAIMGNILGATSSNGAGLILGLNVANENVALTLARPSFWDNYITTDAEDAFLLNNGNPASIVGNGSWRSVYTLLGTLGANAQIGDAGLNNSIDGTMNFTGTTGSGSAVYDADLVWSPAVKAFPYAGGCGKLIEAPLKLNLDGSKQQLIQIVTMPELNVNGVDVGPLVNALVTGNHAALVASTPGTPPLQINEGDMVALTAPSGWAITPAGAVQALSGMIDNRVGKSSLQVETLDKTLALGFNMSATAYTAYFPWKNFKYATGFPGRYGKMAPGIYQMTVSPSEIGEILLVWDATIPATPSIFDITTPAPDLVLVTQQSQYDVNPVSGIGYQRVFNIAPVPGSAYLTTIGGFILYLRSTDPAFAGTPNYNNLRIFMPGEWSLVNGVPSFDSTPFVLSDVFLDRVTENCGSLRWVEYTAGGEVGGTFPYPELMADKTAEFFWNQQLIGPRIGFQSLGPVDTTVYPYTYHWTYGRPNFQGSPYTATLAQAITTAPPVKTYETWVFSDGATAPLMAGLQVKVDSEEVRLVSQGVDANHWLVYRGSNGTTPAVHAAGPVTVYGRRTNWIPSSGFEGQTVTCLITTVVPHGMVDRQQLAQGPNPINIVVQDPTGATVTLNNFQLGDIYVTGPNTYINVSGGYIPAGYKPTGVYTFDPTVIYGQNFHFTGGGAGVPLDVQCLTTAQLPNAAIHINLPLDCVNDLIYEYAWTVRDNFPPDNPVFVEYSNEIWNFEFSTFGYVTVMAALALNPSLNTYQLAYACYRTVEAIRIFKEVFNAVGRGSQIVGVINSQYADPTQTPKHLNFALAQGTPLGGVAVAPYVDYNINGYPDGLTVQNLYDDDQMAELYLHDLEYDTGPLALNTLLSGHLGAVTAYNAANSQNAILIGYEAETEFPVVGDAGGGVRGDYRKHDVTYNPGMFFTQQGFFAILQRYLKRVHIFGLGIGWGPLSQAWGTYLTRTQKHSRGDGRDGASDNRHFLVNPDSTFWIGAGQGTSANQNFWWQDLILDSVRGQAYIDWMNELVPQPVRIITQWMSGWFRRWFRKGPVELSKAKRTPNAPSSLTALTVSQSEIDLTWADNSSNETGFQIQWSLNQSTWSVLANLPTNSVSYHATGLTAATAYYFRVSAYNSAGFSTWSNTATATTTITIPAAPTGLTATAISASEIDLSWTSNSTNETGFQIQRSPDGASWVNLATVSHGVTSYDNTGLNPATLYYYHVDAFNAAGSSSYSNTASATTGTTPGNPYYVAPIGTSGAGTLSSPWGIPDLYTISGGTVIPGPALNTPAGSTVYFRDGTNYGGNTFVLPVTDPAIDTQGNRPLIAPTNSGTSSAPITFRNYPGEYPQFSMAGITEAPMFGDWYGSTFLSYIRFLGIKATAGPFNSTYPNASKSPWIMWGDYGEIGFCEVVGSDELTNNDNHDGIRVNGSENPYQVPPVRYSTGVHIHHCHIHGVKGSTGTNYLNNAAIKFYLVKDAIVEDNYLENCGAGWFDKNNGWNNTFRRNFVTGCASPLGNGTSICGNNEFGFANVSQIITDNVIDSEVEISYSNYGTVVQNNLIRTSRALLGANIGVFSWTAFSPLAGTVTCTTGSPVVLGTGTNFLSSTVPYLVPGQLYVFSGDPTATPYQLLSIQSETQITLTTAVAASAAGSGQTATLTSYSANAKSFNNIILSGGASVWGYLTGYAHLGDAQPPLAMLDYNVYDTPPNYEFGHYNSPVDYTMASIRTAGYETHSASDMVTNIFVDQISYVVKAPYTTFGNTGGPVGPRTSFDVAGRVVATSDILNVARYGPAAIGGYQ